MLSKNRCTKTMIKASGRTNSISKICYPKWRVLGGILLGVVFTIYLVMPCPHQDLVKPHISDQVIFLYYSDLKEAAHFYETIMGFKQIEQTSFLEWVAIYQATDNSYIGIVDEKRGSLKTSKDKPVMLSWITNDVDGWYQYLKEKGINIIRAPKNNKETGIRGMVFKDPGGYTLEFFQWIN